MTQRFNAFTSMARISGYTDLSGATLFSRASFQSTRTDAEG